MKAKDFPDFEKIIVESIPDGAILRWVSYEDHEDIVLRDSGGHRYEIKFYPNRDKEDRDD